MLIGIIAILTISMIGAVNAYHVSYYCEGNKLVVSLNPYVNSNSNYDENGYTNGGYTKYNTVIDLGNGKKVYISINDYSPSNMPGTIIGIGGGMASHTSTVNIQTSKNSPAMVGIDAEWATGYYVNTYERIGNGETHNKTLYNSVEAGKGLSMNINKLTITFDKNINTPTITKKADLKIAKITKKGNYRYVTVKNVGKVAAGKNKLAIYVGNKKIKTVNVASIKAGKSAKIKVAIPKKYKSKLKTFKVDATAVIKESNEKNNSLKAK